MKRAPKKLSGGWLDAVFNTTASEMVVVDSRKNTLVYANERAQAHMLELCAADAPEDEQADYFEGYTDLYKTFCVPCPQADEPVCQYDIQDARGRHYHVTARSVMWEDKRGTTLFLIDDIDDMVTNQKKLEFLAFVDPLTEIPNRRRFLEDFKVLEDDIQAEKVWGGIAISDMDNFKQINDTYGHNTGDLMLKEFVKHILKEPGMKNHIYRLGGDEFIMMFHEARRQDSDVQAKMQELMKRITKAYSLPNIEMECTLSIGVSYFPQHGKSATELMRKADIALYKAKEWGRNQCVLFEKNYEKARAFVDVYVNVLPVLNGLNNTIGYELVDSTPRASGRQSGQVQLAGLDKTLDTLGLEDLHSEYKYFIGYNPQMLTPAVLNALPRKTFVIVVSGQSADQLKHFSEYRQLASHGYAICVKDYSIESTSGELLELAKMIMLDYKTIGEAEIRRLHRRYPQKLLIATGCDTPAQFARARTLGCQLFMGTYYSKPMIKKTKDIEPVKANYMRLLQLCSDQGEYLDFKAISQVIESDVAMSFKLLRLLNSAAIGLRSKVSSIEAAVTYLGEQDLKKWISLLALRGVASEQPQEIVRQSLVRAAFLEDLSSQFTPRKNKKYLFMTGLFSLMDVAMNKTFAEVFDEIVVPQEVSESLIKPDGVYSPLVRFVRDYESGHWERVSAFVAANGLTSQSVSDAYLSAVQWYSKLVKDLI